jgi:hypothetical protein
MKLLRVVFSVSSGAGAAGARFVAGVMLVLSLTSVISVASGSLKGAGTTGAQFLNVSVAAKPASMGNASAVLAGAQAVFYNPAGICRVESGEVFFSQINWIKDIRYSNVAAVQRIGGGMFALGINYLSMPAITKYNNLGVRLDESYSPADMAFTAGYARSLRKTFDVGCNVKYISSKIDVESANALALDVGAMYRPGGQDPFDGNNLLLGCVIQNMGTPMKYVNDSDPLPMNIKLGGSYRLSLSNASAEDQGIVLAADVNTRNDIGFYGNMGVELYRRYGEYALYALRCGYRTDLDSEVNDISLGFGGTYRMLTLDYAYALLGELGLTHRLSLSIRFGAGMMGDSISSAQ